MNRFLAITLAIGLPLLSETAYAQDVKRPTFADPAANAMYDADASTYTNKEPYSIQWPAINEKEVLWRKRVTRTIDAGVAQNNLLMTVSGKSFTAILAASVQSGQTKAYSNRDDNFRTPLAPEEFNAIVAAETVA